MNILLKYPSRERPELFAATVHEWTRLAAQPDRIKWIVSLDADDLTLPIYRSKCDQWNIDPIIGASRNKVDAVNRDLDAVRAAEWDVVVLVSDDMRPVVHGWDDEIRRHMATPDMALWFVDGRQDDLCTLSIFGRPIFDRMNCVYHPAFNSVYCDDYYHFIMEQQGKLKRIGPPLVFEHQWKRENDDALMRRNEARGPYEHDKRTLDRLKARYLETGDAWAA